MKKVLDTSFYDRKALVVARALIGKFLVRRIRGGKEVALMITETEAYDGEKDLACHARYGKTARNFPMFGPPGRTYVYFTYGMHWMLNAIAGPGTHPAAVLLRGAGGITGPARLTKFLQIDKVLNDKLLTRTSGLWIEDRGMNIAPSKILRTPRIGIGNAGTWKNKPWRFVLAKEKERGV